jgi:hypothetical protein
VPRRHHCRPLLFVLVMWPWSLQNQWTLLEVSTSCGGTALLLPWLHVTRFLSTPAHHALLSILSRSCRGLLPPAIRCRSSAFGQPRINALGGSHSWYFSYHTLRGISTPLSTWFSVGQRHCRSTPLSVDSIVDLVLFVSPVHSGVQFYNPLLRSNGYL